MSETWWKFKFLDQKGQGFRQETAKSRKSPYTKIQILPKRPRSDTEASLPREGAPGFPSFAYGGQYAVPECRSRSLEPTVGGCYQHVANIDPLVQQHKCHKTSSKVPNTSPALMVTQHPFLPQNEVISFLPFFTASPRQRYKHRQQERAALLSFTLHVHATSRDIKKRLLKGFLFVLLLCFALVTRLKD